MADITIWVKENSDWEYIKCLYKITVSELKKSSDQQMNYLNQRVEKTGVSVRDSRVHVRDTHPT